MGHATCYLTPEGCMAPEAKSGEEAEGDMHPLKCKNKSCVPLSIGQQLYLLHVLYVMSYSQEIYNFFGGWLSVQIKERFYMINEVVRIWQFTALTNSQMAENTVATCTVTWV